MLDTLPSPYRQKCQGKCAQIVYMTTPGPAGQTASIRCSSEPDWGMAFRWKMTINLSQETCRLTPPLKSRAIWNSPGCNTLTLSPSLDKYQMAGWPIELCFPNHLAAVSAYWKVIVCICARVHTSSMSFHVNLPWEYVIVPVLVQCSLLIPSPPRGLLCFSAFFFFLLFCCGWKSSRLSQLPGLWLTTAHNQNASIAGWALQHHTGEPWEPCSLWVELQLWPDEQHIVKQPPLLCSLLVTLQCVVCFRAEAQVRGPKKKVNRGRNMDFWWIDCREECDNNIASRVDTSEDASAGYLLEPGHVK